MSRDRRVSLERLARLILPSDVVNLAFFLLLLALSVLFAGRIRAWPALAVLYASTLVSGCALIWFYRGNPGVSEALPRRWFPLAFILIAFFSVGEMVHHVLPYDVDSELIAFDYWLFGTHPTVYLSRFLNPYLVDALELCYASFFFLPVIVAAHLYFTRRMGELETFATAICLGFYLSFLGNLLFPASGPSRTLVELHPFPLEGKWVGGFIRALLFRLEPYRWDCFPSGHVAVTLLTLFYCRRYELRLFWYMLPVGTGLLLSTVFLRYHYVGDVLAGAVLAAGVVALTAWIQRAWQGFR